MNLVRIVYVKSEGTLGVVLHEYPDRSAWVKWYVDGISYSADLDEEEFEVRLVGVVNE